jgi:DNA-binding NarL/FixJ family response regulator
MPIRVLVVDDHRIVRAGVRRVLQEQEDIETVGEAGTADEAVAAARETRPDVVLMDVSMPGRSGIDALPEVLEAAPGAGVVLLSMEDGPRHVRQAFELGALGYVLKEDVDAEVVAAVRQVAEGREYVSVSLGGRIAKAEADAARKRADDPLTDREREVLRMIALGHANQEISAMLGVSVRTVEAHRAHILTKLRLATRADLVRHAIEQGLLEDP